MTIGSGNVIQPAEETAVPVGPQAAGDHAFISYSRIDGEWAVEFREHLEACGHRTWLDAAKVSAGEDWWRQVRGAIDQAAAFITLLSSRSEQRGWTVQRSEIVYAAHQRAKRHLPIIPVRLDECVVPAVPIQPGRGTLLSDLDHVDYFVDSAEAINRIISTLG